MLPGWIMRMSLLWTLILLSSLLASPSLAATTEEFDPSDQPNTISLDPGYPGFLGVALERYVTGGFAVGVRGNSLILYSEVAALVRRYFNYDTPISPLLEANLGWVYLYDVGPSLGVGMGMGFRIKIGSHLIISPVLGAQVLIHGKRVFLESDDVLFPLLVFPGQTRVGLLPKFRISFGINF